MMMPDFATADERKLWIIQNADYWTAVAFMGRGKYDRHECKSLEDAARTGHLLAQHNGKQYMIYAVAGDHDTLVHTVGPQAKEPKGVNKVQLTTRLMTVHELGALTQGAEGYVRVEKAALRGLLADYTTLLKALKGMGVKVATEAPRRQREIIK